VLERLEDRLALAAELVADPFQVGKTALVVVGTSGKDYITFSAQSGKIKVTLNGVQQGGLFSPTGHLIAYGDDGDDTIQVASKVSLPTVFYGDAGNDTLKGSRGESILLGGEGDDKLLGNKGRDLLIGGEGADVLNGGDDNDLLIAGATSYDEATADNQQALALVLTEWSRSGYADRIRLLRNGGGLNRLFRLSHSTVVDDDSVDTVNGGRGRDWFLLNFVGGTAMDASDGTKAEIRTDI
jgi:Ca2+-binding RTX toxin-like protein